MSFKKTAAIVATAGALAAISVPAMALENQFNGMYRAYGYYTNALSGAGGFNLAKDSATDKFIEQRARLMYTAKASDDLKLVTHFELDTKFGGSTNAKYANGNSTTGPDAGGLDADRVTLETKNVYLDFNCPITGSKVKVGIQPFNDTFQGTWGNFDATGIAVSKKFGDFTATYAYITAGQAGITADSTKYTTTAALATTAVTTAGGTGAAFNSDRNATDVNALIGSYAVSKDLTVGASIYDVNGTQASDLRYNILGVNAAGKFGPAAVSAFLAYQAGDISSTVKHNAFGGAVAAKVDVGAGKVNAAAIYLSGNDSTTTKSEGWLSASAAVNYFTPANMWLITRNAATINSSTAIGGNGDITRGGRGLSGLFAGYEGTADKLFYNANVGAAAVVEAQGAVSKVVGTEVNATVGYKLYPALSVSGTVAYAMLGDGYSKSSGTLLPGGVANADDPFLTNVALNFSF